MLLVTWVAVFGLLNSFDQISSPVSANLFVNDCCFEFWFFSPWLQHFTTRLSFRLLTFSVRHFDVCWFKRCFWERSLHTTCVNPIQALLIEKQKRIASRMDEARWGLWRSRRSCWWWVLFQEATGPTSTTANWRGLKRTSSFCFSCSESHKKILLFPLGLATFLESTTE